MWRGLGISGYKKMPKKPNRGNELGNLFSFAEEYLIDTPLIPVNKGRRLGGHWFVWNCLLKPQLHFTVCAHRNEMRQRSLGWNTPGDKLQQHVAVTSHSCKSLCVYGRIFLWKSLSPQQNFVAATSRTKSNQTEFVRLLAATKLCCWDKDFHKNSLERANCCSNLSSDLYTQSDFVAATCCSDMSPGVLRPYRLWNSLITRHWFNALENEATNP